MLQLALVALWYCWFIGFLYSFRHKRAIIESKINFKKYVKETAENSDIILVIECGQKWKSFNVDKVNQFVCVIQFIRVGSDWFLRIFLLENMNFALILFWLVCHGSHIEQFQEVIQLGVNLSVLFQNLEITELHSNEIISSHRVKLFWNKNWQNWMHMMRIKLL